MRKKLTIFLALALIIATITSCSSSNVQQTDAEKTTDATVTNTKNVETNEINNTEEHLQVEVIDSGYTAIKDGDYTIISFAASLKNPNAEYAIRQPAIQITVRGEDNEILKTNTYNLGWIAAGDTITYADDLLVYEGNLPSNVEIIGKNDDDDFYYVKQKGTDIIYTTDLVISNLSENKGKFSTTYTAEITNNSEFEKDIVTACVVYRKDGKLVGGSRTNISNLKPGVTEPFEIYINTIIENYDSYEMYAFSHFANA